MIRVLPTKYRGVMFRSRTEARWAVFFDGLGLPWQWEPEQFVLPPARDEQAHTCPHHPAAATLAYQPDFHLPTLGLYVEVKPYADTFDGVELCLQDRFVAAGHGRIVTLAGSPGMPANPDDDDRWPYNGFVWGDVGYRWCLCGDPRCRAIGIEFEGRSARLHHAASCYITAGRAVGGYFDREHNYDNELLRAAYASAQTARFFTRVLTA